MEARPEPDLDHGAAPGAGIGKAHLAPGPVSLADADTTTIAAAPPHLLWQSLETAFTVVDECHPVQPRLAWRITLPYVLVVSLGLWAAIIKLVLLH